MESNSSNKKQQQTASSSSSMAGAQQCASKTSEPSASARNRNHPESSGSKPKSGNRRRELNNGDQPPQQQQQQRRGGGNQANNAGGGWGGGGRRDARQRLSASSASPPGSGLDYGDGFAELNSVYVPGSKKQSLNHLLNFNYAPRLAGDARTLQRTGHQRGQAAGSHHHHHHQRYNKEQFLQASCQFVVRADAPLAVAAGADLTAAADHLVDWSLVEQVHLSGTEEPQCPICLHHPAAAKMTRCGHVYCWPCMLHYLALSDQSWRKCPICFEAVHAGDLRSAVVRRCAPLAVGDVVELRLMCRARDSLQVMLAPPPPPVAQPDRLPHLFDAADGVRAYSKLLLADPHEILSIVERERQELLHRRTDDGADCPETMFIEQALALLQQRHDQVSAGAATVRRPPQAALQRSVAAVSAAMGALSVDAVEQAAADADANFVIDAAESALTLVDLQIQPTGGADAGEHYYFYQAADAQLVYMHAVNTRMLQAQWCELRCAPARIAGRILQKDSCSMTEVLRRRLRYLQHLPVGSQFEVVEIELGVGAGEGEGDGAIGEVVQDMFREELEARVRQRQRRATEERKRDRQIEAANDKQLGKLVRRGRGGAADIDVRSALQFPMYEDRDLSPTSFDVHTFSGPPLVAETATGGGSAIAGASRGQRKQQRAAAAAAAVGSFAKMLAAPHQATGDLWPTLAPTAALAGDFPDTLLLGGGRPRRGTGQSETSEEVYAADDDPEGDEDDGGVAAPPACGPNYGTAIAQALAQKEIMDAMAAASGCGRTRGGRGGNNKKKKNLVLLSNARSYNGH